MFKATQSIAEKFDQKNLKYAVYNTESTIEIGFGAKNLSSVKIRFISTDDDNDVKVYSDYFIKTSNDKKLEALTVLNELNRKFRYAKFTMDEDGDICTEYDFPLELGENEIGNVAFEICMRFASIIDEAYLDIRKAVE